MSTPEDMKNMAYNVIASVTCTCVTGMLAKGLSLDVPIKREIQICSMITGTSSFTSVIFLVSYNFDFLADWRVSEKIF